MAVFHEIFGLNPSELGHENRPDFDRRPRLDLALNQRRIRAWEAAETHRKTGDLERTISAVLLVLCYDGLGCLEAQRPLTKFKLEKPVPAYGIFRSLRTRLKKSNKTLADVRPALEAEAHALLAYLPPLVEWPSMEKLWEFIVRGMREVSE